MPTLDALLLVSPVDVCAANVAKGRLVARRATALIEARLRRQLVVRPVVQRISGRDLGFLSDWSGWYIHRNNWARQWPVVQLVTDRPFVASEPLTEPPSEIEGAGYATGAVLSHAYLDEPVDLGDETGERLGLPEAPEDGLAVYLAGFRRPDQTGEAGCLAVNAAITEAHPAWGAEALSADAWARVPVLPIELVTAAEELARGLLSTHGTGLGALASRTEERGESRARVQLAKGWEETILSTIDHLAWLDL